MNTTQKIYTNSLEYRSSPIRLDIFMVILTTINAQLKVKVCKYFMLNYSRHVTKIFRPQK